MNAEGGDVHVLPRDEEARVDDASDAE